MEYYKSINDFNRELIEMFIPGVDKKIKNLYWAIDNAKPKISRSPSWLDLAKIMKEKFGDDFANELLKYFMIKKLPSIKQFNSDMENFWNSHKNIKNVEELIDKAEQFFIDFIK